MKYLLVFFLLLAGCDNTQQEVFDRTNCDVIDTGERSTRKYQTCNVWMKGVCYGWKKHTVETHKYVTTCKKTEWVDGEEL